MAYSVRWPINVLRTQALQIEIWLVGLYNIKHNVERNLNELVSASGTTFIKTELERPHV